MRTQTDMGGEVNWSALARYLAAESPQDEQQRLLAWAEADPRNREIQETARRAWSIAGREAGQWDTEAAWDRVRGRLDMTPAEPRRPRIVPMRGAPSGWRRRLSGGGQGLAVAASITAVLAVGAVGAALWTGGRGGGEVAVQEFVTPKVGRAEAVLSDGTVVMLGPDSRLRLSAAFGESQREVHLEGEAFFEVSHDPSRPFVVRSGATVIRVLGTEFNVRAYPEDEAVQVVVAEGRVAFRAAGEADGESAILTSGVLGELRVGSSTEVARRRVDLDAHLGWRQGRLVFEDAPLSQVAAQLERWYGIPVRISDASLRGRRLTASFRDQPLHEVVAVVAASLGLEYARIGQVYTFFPRGKRPLLAGSPHRSNRTR